MFFISNWFPDATAAVQTWRPYSENLRPQDWADGRQEESWMYRVQRKQPWCMGHGNVSHEMDSDVNISPKVSCTVRYCYVTELRAYDFAIKDLLQITSSSKRGVICAGLCIIPLNCL